MMQIDANGAKWCKLVQKMHKVQMVVEMVVQMLQISANWCKWQKFMLMVLMMQMVVQIGAHCGNWCKWRKLVQMAEIGVNGAHDAVGSAN